MLFANIKNQQLQILLISLRSPFNVLHSVLVILKGMFRNGFGLQCKEAVRHACVYVCMYVCVYVCMYVVFLYSHPILQAWYTVRQCVTAIVVASLRASSLSLTPHPLQTYSVFVRSTLEAQAQHIRSVRHNILVNHYCLTS